MTGKFHIPSNSGTDTITFSLLQSVAKANSIWKVEFITLFENRSAAADRRAVVEHKITLEQVMLEYASINSLKISMQQWMIDFEPFALRLSSTPGQELSLYLGPDPDLLSSNRKPALVTSYKGIAVEFRTWSVLDETCVRLATSEIETVLRELTN